MRAIIQRVSQANVVIQGHQKRSISKGLVILVGIGIKDTSEDVIILGNKILNLRVFSEGKKMDLSIQDISGDLLIISQFTLYADCTKGNRPSFIKAAKPVHAKKIYNEFVNYISSYDSEQQIRNLASNSVELHADARKKIFTLKKTIF